ncbi:3-deoxy-manno-octulosonate cytidylyltransferase [Helicobacter sp. CaF467b]|uniref:3-deoxy-manno-octulosonate cytidylyltransferase n=1 Tax=Helicobacter sp. CaF467b TaxID=2919923 RepID=UPI001F597A95|nr:3-deoxy-manno-octulosonate cytidylyltransferase [Helicobacter sp. CaF467b]MCI2236497.1 3-deoxy-manno-octulosonate cytidylyltransferase [Helicobacter sp. CaF467b]
MIIIPARLKSTRFPNKILAPIGGIPMVIRVAKIAKEVDEVVIACDDVSVKEVCEQYGFKSILTSKEHESGTDRIAECARILGLGQDEIIINLQGDEPFIEKEVIQKLKNLMESKLKEKGEIPFMGSCMRVVSKKEAEDPNLVKVVINQEKEAIYFSRARIPYDRENILDSHDKWQYFGHLGIYAFSGKSLQEFCNLPKLALEEIEKLEQLRAIENKKTIVMVEVCSQSFGIDTKEDLKRALEIFSL